jgi:hypothetical protein
MLNKILTSFSKELLFKLFISFLAAWYFISYAIHSKDLDNWNIIDSIDLIFHEAGHTIFFFLGDFIRVLAGSAFQITLPIVFVLYFFLYRREYFSASLLLFWVGQNIINVSIYMSDAIVQQLPLLGGESSIHDWNYILSYLNILEHTNTIGLIVYNVGFFVIIISAVMSIYFAWYDDRYE